MLVSEADIPSVVATGTGGSVERKTHPQVERARAPAHLCVCVYRGAFLPAGEPGLSSCLFCCSHTHCLEGPLRPSPRPFLPALPHFADSTFSRPVPAGTTSNSLPRPGSCPRKALGVTGRCIRHQMSAGLASKSSS